MFFPFLSLSLAFPHSLASCEQWNRRQRRRNVKRDTKTATQKRRAKLRSASHAQVCNLKPLHDKDFELGWIKPTTPFDETETKKDLEKYVQVFDYSEPRSGSEKSLPMKIAGTVVMFRDSDETDISSWHRWFVRKKNTGDGLFAARNLLIHQPITRYAGTISTECPDQTGWSQDEKKKVTFTNSDEVYDMCIRKTGVG
tara:strand:+ start:88 stop:681 length:594 start_codon:yes stop_codon:yes gene_type:complete